MSERELYALDELAELENFDLSELEVEAAQRNILYIKHQTQLRNLVLCYIHGITQSNFTLSFWENGAIKSISPRGGK